MWRKVLIPSLILAVVAIALVIGVRIQIAPQPAAVAAQNTLAVMYFDNLADPEDADRLGEITTNLLITDLSESQYMRIVSSQRLYDILKLLGKEGEKKMDRAVATQVAQKAGAKWMLLGSILRVAPQLEITTQLVEVASGNVQASQRIRGEPGEEIFSLVDKLTVEIKSDLSLPSKAQREPDFPVADVTTRSPEAYRYYVEGVEYRKKDYQNEAWESFMKALEFDSTFAMVYYELSNLTWGTGEHEMLNKAVKYSDKVSQRETSYIRARAARVKADYARSIRELENIIERYPEEKDALRELGEIYWLSLKKPRTAIEYFNRIVELDSLDKLGYNSLAYAYDFIGEFEKSIWAINKYISLAPNEPGPYDTRGDLYAFRGQTAKAIESFRKAVEIKSDYYPSWSKLGHVYLFTQDYEKAESCYRQLIAGTDKGMRAYGRTCLARIPIHQGRFGEALRVLDDGIAAEMLDQDETARMPKHRYKALVYLERKEWELALQEEEVRGEIYSRLYPEDEVAWWSFDYGRALAMSGRIEESLEVARALEKDVERKDPTGVWVYWELKGNIELARGNAEAAVDFLEKAREERGEDYFGPDVDLGRAYLEAGRLDAAVGTLERVLLNYSYERVRFPIRAVKAHYLLALAYERSGWTDKAIEQYEQFLDIWKDADPGMEEIEDAKTRLASLKNSA
jgi:tetratricopeptide (TPR) repeat protein